MWIIILWVLNLIDAISTHAALQIGWAREVNPFMAYLYAKDPLLFFAYKIVIGSIGCMCFSKIKKNKFMNYVVVAITISYSMLIYWHGLLWIQYFMGKHNE